ncbi:MAG: phosphotransferase family protein [Sphingomonadales bacterium]|nr:phosphotransferase family protein [Sphingomonadales bacterium]MBD3773494.1 phosphotransferase family protein [Paracoccaceae bacterium]
MTGTAEVAEKDRLDETALAAWMQAHVDGFAGPMTLSKFKGGQSNPTYRIDTPGASYVLRRQPFGDLLPSAHAVDREYRVMSALGPQGFPVPRTFGLCEEREVIGAKFFVMAMVEGRNLWDGAMPGRNPGERRELYHAMIDTMADLHRFDPAAVGLGDYGKPTDYCARQLHRWSKQYKLSETEEIAEMDRLIAFLPGSIPEQHASSIVHGDYRLDNMIFHASEPRVVAVLDWELSTLGDPIADFANLMINWLMPPEGRASIGGLPHAELGIPTIEQAVERYVARTGYPVPPMDWYFAFCLFRLAAILQGVKKRALDGNASNPHALRMGRQMRPLAEAAWHFAEKAGA